MTTYELECELAIPVGKSAHSYNRIIKEIEMFGDELRRNAINPKIETKGDINPGCRISFTLEDRTEIPLEVYSVTLPGATGFPRIQTCYTLPPTTDFETARREIKKSNDLFHIIQDYNLTKDGPLGNGSVDDN